MNLQPFPNLIRGTNLYHQKMKIGSARTTSTAEFWINFHSKKYATRGMLGGTNSFSENNIAIILQKIRLTKLCAIVLCLI